MNAPRRRALLGTVGLVASGLGARCLQQSSDPATASATDSGASTTADAETPTRESTGGSTERTTQLQVRTDDLFLANERSDDHRLDVRVTRSPEAGVEGPTEAGDEDSSEDSDEGSTKVVDGERLLYRRYEIPAGSTLEFPNLGVVGRWYVVEMRYPGGEWRRFDWAVLDCSKWATPTQEPRTPEDDPTLNTDALVRIRDDGFEFLRNECDAIAFSLGVAAPASDHVVADYVSDTTTE